MTNDLWNKWSDCHNAPDQQKRIASAKKSACTPVSLEQPSCTGTFKGSSGTHTTALDHCSCVDFNRRHLPCKHMYRLAMELEFFQSDFASDKSAIIEPTGKREKISETVKVIETLTDDQQLLLLETIRSVNTNNPTTCCKSTPDLDALIDARLIEPVSDIVQCLSKYKKTDLITLANSLGLNPEKKLLKADLIDYLATNARSELEACTLAYTSVRPCSQIKYGKVRMYLHRKFDTDDYYNEYANFRSDRLLNTILPDDDVTELLIQYGYYKRQSQ